MGGRRSRDPPNPAAADGDAHGSGDAGDLRGDHGQVLLGDQFPCLQWIRHPFIDLHSHGQLLGECENDRHDRIDGSFSRWQFRCARLG